MARGAPFPTVIDEFEEDPRISFSSADNVYTLIDDNGAKWEFNVAASSWFSPATEEQIAAYQAAYGGPATADEIAESQAAAKKGKKRKDAPTSADGESKKPKAQENRGVYITHLPPDTTAAELETEFSRWGIIDKGADGSARINMYKDENGVFKGEALVVYFKKESVDMAIRMMDDSWFRHGHPNIHVKEADMSYKRTKDKDEASKKLSRQDRKALERTRAELQRKNAEWSSDDEVAKETYKPKVNKWARFVIIKHAFTLEGLEEDKAAMAEIKEDMMEAAEVHGTPTKVVLYDKEPEGIVAIRFTEIEEAANFAKATNGRGFDGRKLEVFVANDRPKYRKTVKGTESDEEEELERLDELVGEGIGESTRATTQVEPTERA